MVDRWLTLAEAWAADARSSRLPPGPSTARVGRRIRSRRSAALCAAPWPAQRSPHQARALNCGSPAVTLFPCLGKHSAHSDGLVAKRSTGPAQRFPFPASSSTSPGAASSVTPRQNAKAGRLYQAPGATRARMRDAWSVVRLATTVEVRLDVGKGACFIASAQSIAFDRVRRTRCAIYPCLSRPKGQSCPYNCRESGECRFEALRRRIR
jgi:hypothetical protein